jgi:hypothetical protein
VYDKIMEENNSERRGAMFTQSTIARTMFTVVCIIVFALTSLPLTAAFAAERNRGSQHRSRQRERVEVTSQVERGYILEVLGTTDGWLYVQLPNGEFGWVMAEFTLRLEKGSG